MERSRLRELYARCDPYGALPADDDELYVDVDHVATVPAGQDPEALRPRRYAWINHIAKKFELSARPRQILLTGLPGSGKSTELRRVASRLARSDSARLYTVHIDAEKVLDLSVEVNIADIVLVIIAETERAVLELEAKHSRSQDLGSEGPFERMWDFLKLTEIGVTGARAGDAGILGLGIQLKTDPSLRERVRKSVAERTTEFLAKARAEMANLEARVTQYEVQGQLEHKYAGVFVLFDSLEKLRGHTHNYTEVLDSAEVLMSKGAEQVNLGVHALFTVPIAVARRIEGVQLMPLIKYRQRDTNQPFEPGRAALRHIIDKRLPPDALTEIFGEGERLTSRMNRLIERSGGYPRELVTLLQEALEQDFPLSDAAFERLLANRADECKVQTEEARDLLRRVHREDGPMIGPAEHRQLMERLLTNSLVFVYQNDEEWASVNPALESLMDSRDDD